MHCEIKFAQNFENSVIIAKLIFFLLYLKKLLTVFSKLLFTFFFEIPCVIFLICTTLSGKKVSKKFSLVKFWSGKNLVT